MKPVLPLPGLHDADGAFAPSAPVFDAHVHLFPDRVFDALRRWFDVHAWPIRYRLPSEQAIEFLATRGVRRMLGLCYAHRPGMARALNDHLLDLAQRYREVVPLATALPGEEGTREVVRRALGEGARGVKLHCHVQQVAPDDPRLFEICEELVAAGRPLVLHAGREPSSDAYGVDTRALCGADAVARLLERFPGLTLVVPHLGADEFAEYEALLGRFPRLFLDTTMAVARYFPWPPPLGLVARHSNRILYGSDFPNLPYAWDRELAVLAAHLSGEALSRVLWKNAAELFGE